MSWWRALLGRRRGADAAGGLPADPLRTAGTPDPRELPGPAAPAQPASAERERRLREPPPPTAGTPTYRTPHETPSTRRLHNPRHPGA